MKAVSEVIAADGEARFSEVTLAGGKFHTPCFMPVGTRGAVKHLSSSDMKDLNAEIILGNT